MLRLFAAFHVLKGAVLTLLAFGAQSQNLLINLLPIATAVALLAFLLSGRLRERIGRRYIDFAVILSTLDALMTKGTFWYWRVTDQLSAQPDAARAGLSALVRWLTEGAFDAAPTSQPLLQMSMIISLLMLLIVVSWQYGFRPAGVFILLTTTFDLLLNVFLVTTDTTQVLFGMSIIAGRTFIFLVIARVITHLVGIQNRQQQSLIQANAELARYAATVEELTISRERNRLARELHDTVAHTLSAATLQLEATQALWDTDAGKAQAALSRATGTIRDGLTETRRALKALRAAPLDDLGFELALRELADTTQQRSGAQVQVSIAGGLAALPGDTEQALYRVAQEALENIVRHANARQVRLELAQRGPALEMVIQDDGVGFDVDQARRDSYRFGLRGIVERIEELGGRAQIESNPNSGTRIALQVGGA